MIHKGQNIAMIEENIQNFLRATHEYDKYDTRMNFTQKIRYILDVDLLQYLFFVKGKVYYGI